MQTINDVINGLVEIREEHGNIECVNPENEPITYEFNDDDDDHVVVFE